MATPAAASSRDAEPSAASSAQLNDEEELEDFAISSSDDDNDANEPQLDQDMMNELLLVCSNLGMLRVQTEGEAPVLMRGENCAEWIHDLQRAIRRDHAKHKLVAKQLGKWKILQKKLLPLLVNHQHDWKLVFSILKVLVMLTMKPPRDSTNIAQQLKYLRQYKHEFLRCGVIPIMMTILVDPLSRKGSARTPQDFLNMEIVLTLIRNLLAIPNEDPRFVTSTTSYFSHLQEDFICTLHEENVYEMILLFAQDIDSPDNKEWNLLIMEMIELTLDCSQPKAIVTFAKKQWAGEPGKISSSGGQTTASVSNLGRTAAQAGGSLLAKLSSEKKASALHQTGSRRHSNFGGIMTMEICDSIVGKSYFQLTNSLKTEFRRGSTKLISTDRLQYFHLVWFLTTYHRLKVQALKSHYKHQLKEVQKKTTELQNALDFTTPPPPPPPKPDYNEKAVLSTLDMFSFNFVLQSIENYATLKNYHGMTGSVQLLAEMMAYLAELTAMLLKTWSPGLFPKAYVVDVVTLTHLVFKVLDSQGTIKVLSRRKAYLDKKRQKKKRADGESKEGEDSDDSSTDEEETERQAQLLMEMQRKEADFDVRKYFSSMVSADTIRMYCSVLADYRENGAKVNHYIHSFFYRTKHFKIYPQEEWSMQPMLFNIHVLLLFNKMLQDTYIQRLPEYKSFLDFIRGVVRDFFTLANTNNLLFVEALLRQTYPSKSCMLIQRSYDPLDSMSKSKSEAVALGREKRIEAINESRRHRIALDHEELEGEAEFQFTLGPSDFQSTSLVDKEGNNDEGEAESNTEGSASNPSEASSAPKPKRKAPMSRAATERAKNWSKVEDRYLAKAYMKYRHLPSVYEVVSYEDMFQERDRTPEQIERRVKYLKLHRKTHDSSDEEENEQSASDGEANIELEKNTVRESRLESDFAALDVSRPRRRLRRGADLSDDDSDDDMLSGGPAKQSAEEQATEQLDSSEDTTDKGPTANPSTSDGIAALAEAGDTPGSQEDVGMEAADLQSLKRSRPADEGVQMEEPTPAKKAHRDEAQAPNTDESDAQP
eukprot:jgi/Phyca11/528340/estExt2_fgenesh1_pm.C_PHYCAscaffold_290020